MFAAKSWGLLRETANDWLDDKVPRMGAALAYYAIFSLAPLLLIAISIAGWVFGEQAAQRGLHQQIAGTVGDSAAAAAEEILAGVHRSGSGWLGTVVGVVVLLFGASGVFVELQDALNTIWKVKPEPGVGVWGVVRARLFSFLVVLATGLVLLVSVVVSTVLGAVENALRGEMAGGGWLWSVVNGIVAFVLVAVLFAMIYKVMPETKVTWRNVRVGAVVAALLFTLGKYLISLYLTHGAVASAFGAAGSVIVLLVWVYYSSQILLFGAEFTRVCARHHCAAAGQPGTGERAESPAPPSAPEHRDEGSGHGALSPAADINGRSATGATRAGG
jgi:membrane protein